MVKVKLESLILVTLVSIGVITGIIMMTILVNTLPLPDYKKKKVSDRPLDFTAARYPLFIWIGAIALMLTFNIKISPR